MILKTIPQTEFEFPVVATKALIIKEYKDILKENRDTYVLDLGCHINIFEYFTPIKYIEENYVKTTTEYLLLQVANAYKWVDNDVLHNLLEDYANKIRKKSLGGIIYIEMYKSYIRSAIDNKDTIEIETNKTLRFLTNPYYDFKGGEYSRRRQLRTELINKALSDEKREINFKKIHNYIIDYDLSSKTITKKRIALETGLSYATIKNYLTSDPELAYVFQEVRKASGTDRQKSDRKYYRNRICKKVNESN
ncbi:MAG: hypothetical protein HOJ53_03270 [Flavobacteriaceae bacterium]|nr:hypothetical protein [Flavobacteriaceae bacterium]